VIDPNPPTPLPAIRQTPGQESDKPRLAFRTKADTVPHAFQEMLLIG